MRLPRPYIPIAVRLKVAERQALVSPFRNVVCGVEMPLLAAPRHAGPGKRLRSLLGAMFPDGRYELHHRPALANRRLRWRLGKPFYTPPANDPAFLVYLAAEDHDIETRVRGVGAQRSDLGQIRYNKRVARNRTNGFRSSTNKSAAKRKWPKRPLRSRGFR
jgi:hypothetical protein